MTYHYLLLPFVVWGSTAIREHALCVSHYLNHSKHKMVVAEAIFNSTSHSFVLELTSSKMSLFYVTLVGACVSCLQANNCSIWFTEFEDKPHR